MEAKANPGLYRHRRKEEEEDDDDYGYWVAETCRQYSVFSTVN
jgi:hypothetical protein